MSVFAIAGQLAEPGLKDLQLQHEALAYNDEELASWRNAILDQAFKQASQDVWAELTGDTSIPPDIQLVEISEPEVSHKPLNVSYWGGERFVKVAVTWDGDDTPFGCVQPGKYQWVPFHVYEEGMDDYGDAVADWLSDRYGFAVCDWEDTL